MQNAAMIGLSWKHNFDDANSTRIIIGLKCPYWLGNRIAFLPDHNETTGQAGGAFPRQHVFGHQFGLNLHRPASGFNDFSVNLGQVPDGYRCAKICF